MRLGRLLATGHHNLARADRFDDLKLRKHADGGIDLRRISRYEGNHGGGGEIHGLPSEVLDDWQRLRLLAVVGEELDHDQLFYDGVLVVVIGVVDDVDHDQGESFL